MAAEFVFDQRETVARLRDSLSTIESFLVLVPAQWTHTPPPGSPEGAWSMAMNLAHMVVYEEQLATPVLEAMSAGGNAQDLVPGGGEEWLLGGATAIASEPIETLAARLRAVRERAIAIVESTPADLFNQPRTMLWSGRNGGKPLALSWVATKTFQHTWEHGNAILRVAMFTPR